MSIQQRRATRAAERDIEAANATHRATMERLEREAQAATATHRAALADAVQRLHEARGAEKALAALRTPEVTILREQVSG